MINLNARMIIERNAVATSCIKVTLKPTYYEIVLEVFQLG
jgi:hypothetical protein